jgi:ribosomal protein S18 acetylase RimI-like enzyme
MSNPTYFKRYRMEMELRDLPPVPQPPPGFDCVAWYPGLLTIHAQVKAQCFHDELDSLVFPSLGYVDGCLDLMRNITTRADFVPEATWLLIGPFGPCGTIQGLRDKYFGAIQNLGVVSDHRGRGLGRLLLLKALHGFRIAGLRKSYLEVTARNESAVRLYRNVGFRSTRSVYKPIHTIQQDAMVTI